MKKPLLLIMTLSYTMLLLPGNFSNKPKLIDHNNDITQCRHNVREASKELKVPKSMNIEHLTINQQTKDTYLKQTALPYGLLGFFVCVTAGSLYFSIYPDKQTTRKICGVAALGGFFAYKYAYKSTEKEIDENFAALHKVVKEIPDELANISQAMKEELPFILMKYSLGSNSMGVNVARHENYYNQCYGQKTNFWQKYWNSQEDGSFIRNEKQDHQDQINQKSLKDIERQIEMAEQAHAYLKLMDFLWVNNNEKYNSECRCSLGLGLKQKSFLVEGTLNIYVRQLQENYSDWIAVTKEKDAGFIHSLVQQQQSNGKKKDSDSDSEYSEEEE